MTWDDSAGAVDDAERDGFDVTRLGQVASGVSSVTNPATATVMKPPSSSAMRPTNSQRRSRSVESTQRSSRTSFGYGGNPSSLTKDEGVTLSIGSYLLLWPINIIKAAESPATPEQKQKAQLVFDRIRKYTGMKSQLKKKSII
ncbi:uncharacterized protein BCR38DRAFT_489550 [Pseudomassariella vexata]|uniref:Uncharacterized protein n=1 Tax=Pseudomassariella vexata TaxID=1141098 RepID=A0A1Y2DFK6_9PEZI|nr:uncharacterized protein BCR38DRAFT_489550 [Pseudomassariella vexata]ORY58060.1 hypothetical protein BCR38DRAFT_489550 [Pseudomassariella vexata]